MRSWIITWRIFTRKTIGLIKKLTEEFKKDPIEQEDVIEKIEKKIYDMEKNAKNAINEISQTKKNYEKNKQFIYYESIIGLLRCDVCYEWSILFLENKIYMKMRYLFKVN